MTASPRRPYEGTTTTIASSRDAIESLLKKAGCKNISHHNEQPADDITAVYVEFRHKENGADYEYRLRVPVDMKALQRKTGETWEKAETRELMRVWRVLYWQTKRRLEAVEEGVSEWRREFGWDTVEPNSGLTVWDVMHKADMFGRLAVGGPGLPLLSAGAQ